MSLLAKTLPPAAMASKGQGLRSVNRPVGGSVTRITEINMLSCLKKKLSKEVSLSPINNVSKYKHER